MRRKAHQVPGGNKHHLFWGKHFESGLAKQFRDLPCMQVRIDFFAHHLIHLHQRAMAAPSREDMQRAQQRHDDQQCSCYE